MFEVADEINASRFAVKFHKEFPPYLREVRAYECLAWHRVTRIEGFQVPEFLGSEDTLMTIEMTIVKRPFLLDFAGAYETIELPDFPANVWEEWRQQKEEEFGPRWPLVQEVLATLRTYGIHMLDIHSRNITFPDDPAR